jgi:AcrR family transcriptional regulator
VGEGRDEQSDQSKGADDGRRGLPLALELLWDRRPPGRRGPKPALSIEAIVDAAVRLADAQGLEAVSMARVAEELGFTTMSLYRYLSSKDDLLQLMWNASAKDAELLVLEGADWREKLRSWALAQRGMMRLHPWITQMPWAAPPLGPNSLTFVEKGLEALDGTGLSGSDGLQIIGLVASYTLSESRMSHDAARAATAATPDDGPPPGLDFEAILRQVVDEQNFPRLYRIAWSTGPDANGPDAEEQAYLFGLDRILDGVQALIGQTG